MMLNAVNKSVFYHVGPSKYGDMGYHGIWIQLRKDLNSWR